jgi:predicted aspartyl protease
MPAFTTRITEMQRRGPLVQVNIAVAAAAEQALTSAGQPVPPPVAATALIDTGATGSAISRGIAQQLGLQPVGAIPVSTPSSASVIMAQYAIRLLLPNSIVFETTAIEAQLAGQGIGALIGRDVLAQAVFVYIGYTNEFTIAL